MAMTVAGFLMVAVRKLGFVVGETQTTVELLTVFADFALIFVVVALFAVVVELIVVVVELIVVVVELIVVEELIVA